MRNAIGQARRIGRQVGKFAPRQAGSEKARDLRSRKAQIIGSQDCSLALEHGRRDLESDRQFSTPDRQVEVGGTPLEKQVEDRYRSGPR